MSTSIPVPATDAVALTAHIRTVPRQLVHRCAVSEVFLTSLLTAPDGGCGRRGPGTPAADFVVGAQLPRMHGYYGDHQGGQAGLIDPLLAMETGRQAAIAITHEFLDVDLDSAFLVRTFNGTGHPGPAWEAGELPADLEIAVQVVRRHTVDGRLRGLDLGLELTRDGRPLMTVDGSFSWMSPRRWRAMRSAIRAGTEVGAAVVGDRALPAMVARELPRNVVIGPPQSDGAGTRADLVVDVAHPGLFDHTLDHVPGSLMLEACRQLAVSHAGPRARVISVHSTFDTFVEIDRPAVCLLTDLAPDGSAVEVTVEQGGVRAARVRLDLVVGHRGDGPGTGTEG
ncbi:MAG: ScbA/BarX family gamma-butyrolactone biosynthesis protein [Gordonia sp. (in: high G+C Gram-positive bacteria)]